MDLDDFAQEGFQLGRIKGPVKSEDNAFDVVVMVVVVPVVAVVAMSVLVIAGVVIMGMTAPAAGSKPSGTLNSGSATLDSRASAAHLSGEVGGSFQGSSAIPLIAPGSAPFGTTDAVCVGSVQASSAVGMLGRRINTAWPSSSRRG